MSRSKDIGTRAESAVVAAIRPRGFPHAERRALAGEFDLGDLTGTPGICWEVKGGDKAKDAGDGQIGAWLAETERERINSGANVGVLVTQRRGVGLGNAHRWWAWLPLGHVVELGRGPEYVMPPCVFDIPVRMLLEDACLLLRSAGYGEPLEAVAP
ncbi:hypothetical protein E1295_46985 [Nonomuraea mesophila]|uniref:Holliday junction resolvase n=1 Tax=Nonomuraea mesophila TaxID=2530382 RepID=A0A4R5E3Z8_9ACTN|nr:hypothetical protein [Nonomuraea mesophila]TDE20849.1 hypothetical protein E1295_46985 [Nonomuraea mesophila]